MIEKQLELTIINIFIFEYKSNAAGIRKTKIITITL
jgi:hypothetical protein